METCPCGSEVEWAECCEPIITGTVRASSPEQLMRSRYSAYTTGAVDWIIESNHPDTREDANREDIERWSTTSDWLGLTIIDTEAGGPEDDEGWVRFRARYRMDGHTHQHKERAYFQRHEGEWYFHGALADEPEPLELVPVTAAATVGRNDPCTCGSGKKYKRCCGAG